AKLDKLLEKVQSKVEGWKSKLLYNGVSRGNSLRTLAYLSISRHSFCTQGMMLPSLPMIGTLLFSHATSRVYTSLNESLKVLRCVFILSYFIYQIIWGCKDQICSSLPITYP
ncbi:hypothetical protein GIB67_005068, partial [Kingdonia uniflora]